MQLPRLPVPYVQHPTATAATAAAAVTPECVCGQVAAVTPPCEGG
jgi:hypothetical protein